MKGIIKNTIVNVGIRFVDKKRERLMTERCRCARKNKEKSMESFLQDAERYLDET